MCMYLQPGEIGSVFSLPTQGAFHMQRMVLKLLDCAIRGLVLSMLLCPSPSDFAVRERATDNFEKCS